MEKVFVVSLVFSNICFLLASHALNYFEDSETVLNWEKALLKISQTSEIAAISILCFSLYSVNRQLALFFD